MEEVAKEAKAQQEQRNCRRVKITEQRKMRLLNIVLCSLLATGASVRCGGMSWRVASRVRWRVTTNMYWCVMHPWKMQMDMPSSVSMTVAPHEAGCEKEAKAQQEAENEDQGKRISSDQSIPSFRGNTCLAFPHALWGSIPIDG